MLRKPFMVVFFRSWRWTPTIMIDCLRTDMNGLFFAEGVNQYCPEDANSIINLQFTINNSSLIIVPNTPVFFGVFASFA